MSAVPSAEKMTAANVSSHEILRVEEAPEKISGGIQTFIKSEHLDKLEIDLSVKCRGCFAEDSEMHFLFTIFDQQLSLADILTQTTPFICKEDDGFPPYLCTKCTTCLIDFFNFKIQFQKTDFYVRTLLGKAIPPFQEVKIKNEFHDEHSDDDDDDDNVAINEQTYEDNVDFHKFLPDIKGISGNTAQCTFCQLFFTTFDECQTHMAKDHGKNPFLKYEVFRKQIADHEKAIMVAKRRKKYKEASIKEDMLLSMPGKLCRLCRKKYPEDQFRVHWETHKIHVCEQCGHKCIKKSDLDIHRQSVHNEIRNFSCHLCGKLFKIKSLLRRHQRVHLNLRSYCCDLCGQRFNDSGTLKTHIQLKHVGNRDFICPICGLAFPMKSTLDKHILRHNKNRPPSFYCNICSSGFKDKSSLKRHHIVKHTNDFVRPSCQDCGKSYCSTTKLRYHIERHHSGVMVERKKRGPKKAIAVQKYQSSEGTDTEESSASSEETGGEGPNVRNVSADFYKRSPNYSSCRENEDPDYKKNKEDFGSEEESDNTDLE